MALAVDLAATGIQTQAAELLGQSFLTTGTAAGTTALRSLCRICDSAVDLCLKKLLTAEPQ